MELKQALDETVLTYSARAFSLTEQLNNTGKPIPEYMLVTAYKRGLRDEYEGVLTAVNAREVAPCMQDLMTMLCAHESMLLAKSSRSQPTAMAVVHGKPGRPPIWERSSGGGQGSRSPGGGGSGSGSWRGSGGGDGGSWRGSGDGGRPKERVCFRCHQPGHLAAECRAPAPVPRPQAAEAPAGRGKESPEGIFFALMASGGAVSDTRPVFLLDTCASHHVAADLSLFVAGSYVETPDAATVVGVGGPCRPEGRGDVLVMSAGPKRSYSLLLRDVLHVPSMGAAVLVGWHKLQQAGVQFEVVQNGFLGMMQGHCIMQAVWQAGVPMLHMRVKRPEDRRVEERDGSAMAFAITDEVMRLHRRLAHMGLTGMQNMAREEAVMDFPEISRTATLSCDACHMGKMKSLPFGDSTTKYEPGEALSFDISGKLPQGYNGNQYFGVGVDHGSRYCIVNTFTLKSEAGPFVKSTATRFSVLAERKPTLLRTENGCELITGDNLRWMQDNGVQDQQSAPYTPAQNGIAERHIGKIKTQVVTMLIDAGLDVKYWPDAVMAAGLLTNLKVSHGSKTPHELITGEKPVISGLRPLGCRTWVRVPTVKRRGVFAARGLPGVFLGYQPGGKSYRCLMDEDAAVVVSRDVVFEEDVFPLRQGSVGAGAGEVRVTVGGDAPCGPPMRRRVPVAFAAFSDEEGLPWVEEPMPQSAADVLASPNRTQWEKGMEEDMESHAAHGTWVEEPLPEGQKALGVHWVFDLKRDEMGRVVRYKARLVRKGYSQRAGVDYGEVWAPCSAAVSVRMLVSLVAERDLELEQLDVKTAFLNGMVDVPLWMEQPPGFEGRPGMVCRLVKAIYGLKQAPRQWHLMLRAELQELGFRVASMDEALYICESADGVCYLIVHVDDMLLGGDKLVVDRAKSGLGAKFTIKDLGAARLFLGMEVTRDRVARTLTLTQYKMSVDLLHTFSMSKSKAVAVPMVAGLDRLKGEPFVDGSKYRSLVGSLMYLAVSTRPDLAHTAISLGRYSHSPTKPRWEAAQHVLRYLNGTVNRGIKFGGGADHGLVGFVDSDYAGDESDRSQGAAMCSWRVLVLSAGRV
ncbi:hypothetical protein FOA52_003823 [Chlamydomonas sp. UWO 241]|nr:hypothetical protein FOA52_003823 [Chlamydomonas sp. UWO 241]